MDKPDWAARFKATQIDLQSRPIDLMWFGDSIVQQFQKAQPDGWQNYRPIWERFYEPRRAINLGFAGDTTANLLWRVENGAFEGLNPRLGIILIGANNFGALKWDADATFLAIEQIVRTLKSRLPGMNLLVLGVLPSGYGAWTRENTRQVNHLLAKRFSVSADAKFIDVGSLVLKDGSIDPECFLDRLRVPPGPPLHPTAQTQERIAEAIEPVVYYLMNGRTMLHQGGLWQRVLGWLRKHRREKQN